MLFKDKLINALIDLVYIIIVFYSDKGSLNKCWGSLKHFIHFFFGKTITAIQFYFKMTKKNEGTLNLFLEMTHCCIKSIYKPPLFLVSVLSQLYYHY
jgi:hypothetical protein